MNILLIVPKYNLTEKKDYSYNFPLGLAYISAVIKRAKYNIDVLNLNHHDGKIEELITKNLDKKKYNIVGTGGNALIYTLLEKIIKTVKQHNSQPKIILGGPIITSEPELIINSLNPDIGVLGEGEETIVELIKKIDKNEDISKVDGIIFKENGKVIITNPRQPVANLDSLPFPDVESIGIKEQLDNMYCNEYWKNAFDYPRTYYLLGSRSCPFQCTFCYHDSRYRARTLKNVIQEIKEAIEKYKINILLIYDECFAIDKKRVYEFCKEIKDIQKKKNHELKWLCQMRVTDVDENLLKTMKEAGCDVISYGFESYSQTVLNSMNKNITPAQIDKAFKITLNAKIGVQANFIFGDVAETKETSSETLQYFEKNGKGQIGMGFIQPYPNSKIYQHCIKKGIIKDKLEFIKNLSGDHWYNMTDNMNDKEIKQLRENILHLLSKHAKYEIPSYIKKMKPHVYEIKTKCPYCKKEAIYKNCWINNKLNYGFQITCRECKMRHFVVSPFQKIAYRYYHLTRIIRDYQKRILTKIKKKTI